MKKLFLPLALLSVLISCKKEDVVPKQTNEIAFNAERHTVTTTISSEPYNGVIFDSCTNENIHLSGVETYKTSTYNDSTAYFIRYEIDLTGIVGVGEISGAIYSGGGKIVDVTRTNIDGSNVLGSVRMRIVYKSDKDKVVFKQKALFIQIHNEIKVQFDSGYLDSCKLF